MTHPRGGFAAPFEGAPLVDRQDRIRGGCLERQHLAISR